MLIVLAGLLKNLQPVIFGTPPAEIPRPTKTSLLPIIVNLSLALGLGLYMPPTLYHYLNQATLLIVGQGGVL